MFINDRILTSTCSVIICYKLTNSFLWNLNRNNKQINKKNRTTITRYYIWSCHLETEPAWPERKLSAVFADYEGNGGHTGWWLQTLHTRADAHQLQWTCTSPLSWSNKWKQQHMEKCAVRDTNADGDIGTDDERFLLWLFLPGILIALRNIKKWLYEQISRPPSPVASNYWKSETSN